MGKRDDTREEHTSPMGMWRQARTFLTCAGDLRAAVAKDLNKNVPAMFLGCHGLELGLKAYLRAQRVTLRILREDIGHSLVKARDECYRIGMAPLSQHAESVINFAERPHRGHEFRYWHTHRPHWIEIAELLEAGVSVLQCAAPAVASRQSSIEAERARFTRRLVNLADSLRD